MVDKPSKNKKRRRGRTNSEYKPSDSSAKDNRITSQPNSKHDESSQLPSSRQSNRPASLGKRGDRSSGGGSSTHNSILIQLSDDEPTWFQYGQKLPGRDATIVSEGSDTKSKIPPKQDPAVVNKYRALGDGIYKHEVQLSAKSTDKTSDDRWVEATMHKGTLKDRIAAMSVLVSNDPIHKLYALDGLLQLAGCSLSNEANYNSNSKPNSRVAQLAAQSMEDLFRNTLLPTNRKLITLDQRPLHLYENAAGKSLSPRILLLWRFEEIVREKFYLFLRQYLSKSLRDGMELDKKYAIRCASNLLKSLPEGEALILQLLVNKLGDPSKQVASAAGHALRQVLQEHPAMKVVVAREVQQLAHRPNLSARALYNCITFLNQLPLDRKSELAGSLMSTYFRLFDVIVGDKAKSLDDGEQLQSRLLSALLTGVNRAHPYLPKSDQDLENHMDTLYRVVHTATPSARTQALLLLFHVTVGTHVSDNSQDEADAAASKKVPETLSESVTKRQDRFYRALYSNLADPAMIGTGKHLTMFFNLLYKALKYDQSDDRVLSFVKRILATGLHCSPPVVAATLFLVKEITKYHPIMLSCLQDVMQGPDAVRVLDPSKREPRGALISAEKEKQTGVTVIKASLWELSLTRFHYHPSVVKFSESLLDDVVINYAGDPLRDFGLVPFLDKFAYRNPKSSDRASESTKPGVGSVGQRKHSSNRNLHAGAPVNDPSFLEDDHVDSQDEFFRKFFVERARRDELKGIDRHNHKAEDDDLENIQTEKDALDDAEDWDGNKRFEDWEREWSNDPEEEEFVDAIAQKLMEDSIGRHGPAELDDEDPDVDDWGDMYDNHVDEESESSDSEVEQEMGDSAEFRDEDAFMDDDDSSSNSSSELQSKEGEDQESHSTGSKEFGILDDFDSDEDDNESLSAMDQKDLTNAPEKSKRKESIGTFAALEDFEDKINESWHALHRPVHDDDSNLVDEDADEESTPRPKSKRKKQKKDK